MCWLHAFSYLCMNALYATTYVFTNFNRTQYASVNHLKWSHFESVQVINRTLLLYPLGANLNEREEWTIFQHTHTRRSSNGHCPMDIVHQLVWCTFWIRMSKKRNKNIFKERIPFDVSNLELLNYVCTLCGRRPRCIG